MEQRRTLGRLPAAVLVGALALGLALAGGAALAQEGGADPDAQVTEQVVTDETTIEVAWKDANGEEGVDTYTLSADEQASDHAASEPSPTGGGDLTEDPAKS